MFSIKLKNDIIPSISYMTILTKKKMKFNFQNPIIIPFTFGTSYTHSKIGKSNIFVNKRNFVQLLNFDNLK
jgi:hypothetical protein